MSHGGEPAPLPDVRLGPPKSGGYVSGEQAGFSILELVIASSAMAATSVIASTMLVNFLKSQHAIALRYSYQTMIDEIAGVLSTVPGCSASIASSSSGGFEEFRATPVPNSSPAMMAYDLPQGIYYPAPSPSVLVGLPSGNAAAYYAKDPTRPVLPLSSVPDGNNAVGYYGGPSGLMVSQAQLRYKVGSQGTVVPSSTTGSPVSLWAMSLYIQGQTFASIPSTKTSGGSPSNPAGNAVMVGGAINATGPQNLESVPHQVNLLLDGNDAADPSGKQILSCVAGPSKLLFPQTAPSGCPNGFFSLNGGCADCQYYSILSNYPQPSVNMPSNYYSQCGNNYFCTSYTELTVNTQTSVLSANGNSLIPPRDPSGSGPCYYYTFNTQTLSGPSYQTGTDPSHHDANVVSRDHDAASPGPYVVWNPYIMVKATVNINIGGYRRVVLAGGTPNGNSFDEQPMAIDNFFLIGIYPATTTITTQNANFYYTAFGTGDSVVYDPISGSANGILYSPQPIQLTTNSVSTYPDGTTTAYSTNGVVSSSPYTVIPLTALAAAGTAEVPQVQCGNLFQPNTLTTIDFRGLDCGGGRTLNPFYMIVE